MLAQFPVYVALFFSCCTVPTICSHRLKQILLVLQSPVYCYRRNGIQHSSINALLSTEQIPRAFYWISLSGTRQITHRDENCCKVQEEQKFYNKWLDQVQKEDWSAARLPFPKQPWLAFASQFPAMPVQGDQLAATAARNEVGRVIRSCWRDGRRAGRKSTEHCREAERESPSSLCTQKTPFSYRKQHMQVLSCTAHVWV